MSSRVEDLQALARMLDQGKITEAEYETVKAELIAAPPTDWENGEVEASPQAQPLPDEPRSEAHPGGEQESTGSESRSLLDQLRQVPKPYLLGALVGLFLVFAALLETSGGLGERVPAASSGPTLPTEPPEDSLGVRFDGLREGWNSLDLPPTIRRGISVTPEPGPLDGFSYRFDGAAVLAGGYDPSDGYVRALMVRAGLFHPSLGNLYVHLCHLLHPGDQECLETYIEETGVYGPTATDFDGVDVSTEWTHQGNHWSFSLVDNVQTVRVRAPGQ